MRLLVVIVLVVAPLIAAPAARAQTDAPLTTDTVGLIELRFVPTARAQLALWIERSNGEFLQTIRLTEAVAYRGIGNRPGASQMNSGFRWPYGRREGALPIWARARASAPSAQAWKRVIFQDRRSEGDASRSSFDNSRDDYYCLSFTRSGANKDALDAVSCATQFYSDKGRFITEADLTGGYAEPYEVLSGGDGRMRALSLTSLYPPRRDVVSCQGQVVCFDHPDADQLASHAREVMPELDAITMATPQGGSQQRVLFPAPIDWPAGDYRVCLEANVEGDHNASFSAARYPTPTLPADGWDGYAVDWGYPYRGQPSVAYCVDIELGADQEQRFVLEDASGSAASWDIEAESFGELRGMEGMTDDPIAAPGSGADRLALMGEGYRLEAVVRPGQLCSDNAPPAAPGAVTLAPHSDRLRQHEWAQLEFTAASDDQYVFAHEVRVSREPITDLASFMRAEPAKNASAEGDALQLPALDAPAQRISVGIGGLVAQATHYVGVRAIDGCAVPGPIAVAELTTPARKFATVSPCFIASAAFGSPLAAEVGVLRRFRDRQLMSTAPGRMLVDGYYAVGPYLAEVVAERPVLRQAVRAMLSAAVSAASWLAD